VTLALEALKLDPAPSGLAAVLAARTVPEVALALVGGVVADRFPRRTSLLAADLVRSVAVGLVAGLVLLGAINIWGLVAMAVVFGVAAACGGPAQTAILPEVVASDHLAAANALNSASSGLSVNLVGPALGGAAAAANGVAGSFAFDAATFVVSAGLTAALHDRQRPQGERATVVREALQGLRYIATRR
jgi:DHA3 family tetracycline resistance protein-like MFS transporter